MDEQNQQDGMSNQQNNGDVQIDQSFENSVMQSQMGSSQQQQQQPMVNGTETQLNGTSYNNEGNGSNNSNYREGESWIYFVFVLILIGCIYIAEHFGISADSWVSSLFGS